MVQQAELLVEQGNLEDGQMLVTEGIALAQSVGRKSTIVQGEALLERIKGIKRSASR